MPHKLRSVALILTLALGAAIPKPARALDRDVKAVLLIGTYGMAAGTVLGLASYPFTKTPRSIFIGTSVGLYLGIGMGIYYLWDKGNPDNPFKNTGAWAPRPEDENWASRSIGPEKAPPLAYAAFRVASF